MKPAAKMKLKGKKITEPMKEKSGPKLKKERTSMTNEKSKESSGKKVKSKIDVDC